MASRFRECQWWNALHDFAKEERKAGVWVTLPKETDSRVTAAHTVLPRSAWSEMEIHPCGSISPPPEYSLGCWEHGVVSDVFPRGHVLLTSHCVPMLLGWSGVSVSFSCVLNTSFSVSNPEKAFAVCKLTAFTAGEHAGNSLPYHLSNWLSSWECLLPGVLRNPSASPFHKLLPPLVLRHYYVQLCKPVSRPLHHRTMARGFSWC